MWYTATQKENLTDQPDYALDVDAAKTKFDFPVVKNKRDEYVKLLNGIYSKNLDNSEVTKFFGHASFVDNHTIEVG